MSDTPIDIGQQSPPKSPERRYLPRWVVSNRVIYRSSQSLHYREGLSRDVSGDGASLFLEESLTPSEKLTLLIYLCEDIAVEVQAVVLWSRPEEQRQVLGVRFDGINAKIQDMILQYAFECNKKVLTKHWFEGW